ncbi:hypothetical protein ACLOJK_005533 [Asimina triloba]
MIVVDRDGWWEGGGGIVGSGQSVVVAVDIFAAGQWQADEAAAGAGDGGSGVVQRWWSTVAIGLASISAATGTDDGWPGSTDLGLAGYGDEGSGAGGNRRLNRP